MSFPVCHGENMHCHLLYLKGAKDCIRGGGWWVSIALTSHHPVTPPLPVCSRSKSVVFVLNWLLCWDFVSLTSPSLSLCCGLITWNKHRNFFLGNCVFGFHLFSGWVFTFDWLHRSVSPVFKRLFVMSCIWYDRALGRDQRYLDALWFQIKTKNQYDAQFRS